jgi:long-chain acyl-CoA synthetase
VPVPLYETSSAEQVLWILTDADVSLLVVETAAHAATVEEVRADAPTLREVLLLDDGAIDTLVAGGDSVSDDEIARRRGLAVLSDVATVIYTSGTTAGPRASS